MGDINIDSYNQGDAGYNKLLHFCDVYNLSNLIKGKTCFTKNHKSSIDVILTNRPRYFQHTVYFESGLSDYHLMISTSLRAHLIRLKPKIVTFTEVIITLMSLIFLLMCKKQISVVVMKMQMINMTI